MTGQRLTDEELDYIRTKSAGGMAQYHYLDKQDLLGHIDYLEAELAEALDKLNGAKPTKKEN